MKKLLNNTLLLLTAFVFVISFSSCKKEKCTRQVQNADGSYSIEEYYCDGTTYGGGGTNCTTCGNGGGGGTGTYTIYTPGAYTPSPNLIAVNAVIANSPMDMYGEDYLFRSQHTGNFTVARFDFTTGIVLGDGLGGVDNNQMWIWTFSPTYGYMETSISRNSVSRQNGGYLLGAAVTVMVSTDPTRPLAKTVNPNTVHAGQSIATVQGGQALYAEVQ